MKLNDFIKQDPTPKKSGYKVVVGNTPKEQELEKQASQAVVLKTNVDQLKLKVSELEKENDFLKEQVKINQHEKNDLRNKLEGSDNLKAELLEKEHKMTVMLDEHSSLNVLNQKNKDLIDTLQKDLNTEITNHTALQRQAKEFKDQLDSVTSNYNGNLADLRRIKDFSKQLENDYNKERDRNTALIKERDQLSRLKTEFEAKSIRLGDELIKAQEKIKDIESNMSVVNNKNKDRSKEVSKLTHQKDKLEKDLHSNIQQRNELKNSLQENLKDMENLSQLTQIYKEELSRQKREAAEWNIAKQQLKLGNAYTYPNKLGFGASPFFKLGEEK